MSEKILEDQLGYSQKFIDELRQLQKFLLSVTAKDVSMLITFRTIADPSLGKISMTIISIAFRIEEKKLKRIWTIIRLTWATDSTQNNRQFNWL